MVLSLIWETAMRRSFVRSLDLSDWDSDQQVLHIRNRTDQGTRLKNGSKGGRDVAITDETAELIDAWIEGPRPDKTDEYGREPLTTTSNGRISGGCVQTDVYDVLRPMRIRDECSCGSDGCDANGKTDAYKCAGTEGSHTIRASSITYHLNQGWSIEHVSDRADCSKRTLRSITTRLQRREFLDKL